LDELADWKGCARLKREDAGDLGQLTAVFKSTHILSHVVEWFRFDKGIAVADGSLLDDMPLFVGCAKGSDIEKLFQWPASSLLASNMAEYLWEPVRSSILDSFAKEIQLMSSTTMDTERASGIVDDSFAPLLISGDMVPMHMYLTKHVDFLKIGMGQSFSLQLPHAKHAQAIKELLRDTVATEDGRGFIVDAFQHAGVDGCLPISEADVIALIDVYSSIFTSMVMAAAVHVVWFKDGQGFLLPCPSQAGADQ
jgi:hypothetical protein